MLRVGGPKDEIVLSLEAGEKGCLLLAFRSWSVCLGVFDKRHVVLLEDALLLRTLCSFVRNLRSCGTICCECKATSRCHAV